MNYRRRKVGDQVRINLRGASQKGKVRLVKGGIVVVEVRIKDGSAFERSFERRPAKEIAKQPIHKITRDKRKYCTQRPANERAQRYSYRWFIVTCKDCLGMRGK